MEVRSGENKLSSGGPKSQRNDLPPRNNFPPPRPQNSTNDDNGNGLINNGLINAFKL